MVTKITAAMIVCCTSLLAGTYTAASCNRADVNAVINGPTHTAVNGDIILIPSGSCTWTSGITVPSGIGITIQGNGTQNTLPGQTGAGTVNTTINSNFGGQLLTFNPTSGNSTTRVSTLRFTVNSGSDVPIFILGTCTSSGCPNIRLDNLVVPTSNYCSVSDATFARVGNAFGVADHNTIGDTAPGCNGVDFINVGHGNWLGVGHWGDNSWATVDSLGTNQAFFLENNVFNYAFGTDADFYEPNGNFGGGRFVCRFNTFNNVTGASACTNHGTDTGGRLRGGRQMEFYDNSITSCQGGACNTVAGTRSGVVYVFSNSFTGQFSHSFLSADTQRRWRVDSPWNPGAVGNHGPCDGSSPFDTNDGTTYFSGTISSVSLVGNTYTITVSGSPGWTTNQWAPSPVGSPYSFHDVTQNFGFEIATNNSNSFTSYLSCAGAGCSEAPNTGDSFQIRRATVCLDQPGRGQGLLVKGGACDIPTDGSLCPQLVSTGNPGPVAEALDPMYEFADTGMVNDSTAGSNDSQGLIANRDFYSQAIGQTAQTGPTSPFNGTSGTGYGTFANRPTTCTPRVGYWATDQGSWNISGSGGQGNLYICTSTNTWTLSYTPYTYPHPLTTGTVPTAPAPPTNLVVGVH